MSPLETDPLPFFGKTCGSIQHNTPTPARLRRASLTNVQSCVTLLPVPPCLPSSKAAPAKLGHMFSVFEYEIRIRELIQLFARERDPEKLKVLATELQQLLLESQLRKPGRK